MQRKPPDKEYIIDLITQRNSKNNRLHQNQNGYIILKVEEILDLSWLDRALFKQPFTFTWVLATSNLKNSFDRTPYDGNKLGRCIVVQL